METNALLPAKMAGSRPPDPGNEQCGSSSGGQGQVVAFARDVVAAQSDEPSLSHPGSDSDAAISSGNIFESKITPLTDDSTTASVASSVASRVATSEDVSTPANRAGHDSDDAIALEQLAEDIRALPDTSIFNREIKETMLLSLPNKPSRHSAHQAFATGSNRPGMANRALGSRAISDSELPPGHTYQPYFWMSRLARSQLLPDFQLHQALQSRLVNQLIMSEQEARQDFQARFEYRFVDYGFSCSDASGAEPENNYGVFARAPVKGGELLGVYSGIGYVLNKREWARHNHNWKPEHVHQKVTTEMPDFMSYYRTLMAGLRGRDQTQRTLSKYTMAGLSSDSTNTVVFLPDNERYTPMHFLNAANRAKDNNVSMSFVSVNTRSGNLTLPIYFALRDIAVGEELLVNCRSLSPDEWEQSGLMMTAARERAKYEKNLLSQLGFIKTLNNEVPGKQAISPFVAAPAYYASEALRKSYRQTNKQQH
ncbi:SET domain-containing protein-lysine N-methyltransferase [Endozoicomonas sp. ALB115]|uniref:SET domain-containing protein-lysine N-methyltransferase n=1 Tax=Endozoicomonas sp. ALB115 TaxID=3403074 RepID=UPI003BB5C6AF